MTLTFDDDQAQSLLSWVRTFSNIAGAAELESISKLSDGVIINDILGLVDSKHFVKSALRRDTENNWLMRVNNIIRLTESILSYYENYTKMKVQVDVDAAAVGRNGDVNEICKLLTLTINLLMTCDDAQQYVTVLLTQLSVDAQNDIKCAIEALGLVDDSRPDEGAAATGGATSSSTSSTSTSTPLNQNQIDDLHYTISELKSNQQSLEASLEAAIDEKRQLLSVVANLETRVRDNDKEMKRLANELREQQSIKPMVSLDSANSSADDEIAQLRIELQTREDELKTAKRQLENVVRLEKEVRRLTDEVESSRNATNRAVTAEQAMNRMREKLDDFESIKRQLKETQAQLEYSVTSTTATSSSNIPPNSPANEVGKLRAKLASLELSLSSRDGDIERLTTALQRSNEQNDELNRQLQQQQYNNNNSSSSTSTSFDNTRELSLAQDIVSSDSTLVADLRAEIANLQSELTNLRAVNANNVSTTTTLTSTNDTSKKELLELREKVNQLTSDKMRLEGYLKTAKQMIKSKPKEDVPQQLSGAAASAFEQQIAVLKNQLNNKETELAALTAKLAESARLVQREQEMIITAFYQAGLELQRVKSGVPSMSRTTTNNQLTSSSSTTIPGATSSTSTNSTSNQSSTSTGPTTPSTTAATASASGFATFLQKQRAAVARRDRL